jgi:hypothetical protein
MGPKRRVAAAAGDDLDGQASLEEELVVEGVEPAHPRWCGA